LQKKAEMENQKKEDLAQLLDKTDNTSILNAIAILRDEGNDQLLELVIQIYISNSDREVRTAIFQLICDLKNQKSAEFVMAFINNPELASAKQMLVSSCWQSRLNYIQYFELFIQMVFVEPFEIAFEAFTVIENMEDRVSESRKKELINYIDSHLSECRIENQVLADDLVSIIKQYEE